MGDKRLKGISLPFQEVARMRFGLIRKDLEVYYLERQREQKKRYMVVGGVYGSKDFLAVQTTLLQLLFFIVIARCNTFVIFTC